MKTVGIYGVSTQSGMAYFADFLNRSYNVIGYARNSEHGINVVNAINRRNGIYLERPENQNDEISRFIELNGNIVTNDLKTLLSKSSIIILPIPAHYQLEAISIMVKEGLGNKQIPLLLSPSRTFAVPYIWKIVGNDYPIISFSTSPCSSKTIAYDKVYIKRRKRIWSASVEGNLSYKHLSLLHELFPQVGFVDLPAAISLNNIGAVFHPTTYLLNYDIIKTREKNKQDYSFYLEGIVGNKQVSETIESIDQVRLKIADCLGLDTFGLKKTPREKIWRKITNGLRAIEDEHQDDIALLRKIRRQYLGYISNCMISATHWLDITYGVKRIEEESLSDTIKRTPTYQKMSCPQARYIEEDIPTGLVPLEAIAKILNIECNAVTSMIDLYNETMNTDARKSGRNLKEYSKKYICDYLTGKLARC